MSAIDKAKDKAEAVIGGAKEALGKATDNAEMEREGKGEKASGNLKHAGEKVKDAFK